MLKIIALLVFSILHAGLSFAFDVTTHGAITIKATQQSILGANPAASDLAKRLGILNKSTELGADYLHMQNVNVLNRVLKVESDAIADIKKGLGGVPTKNSIAGWLMRGSIREDDNSIETSDSDEVGGVFSRVFGHFFDTVNNRGLTVLGNTVGPRAVDWALDPGSTSTISGRRNYFQIRHARDAMWLALTLKTFDRDTVQTTGDAPDPTGVLFVSKERVRNAYWATTFRALGDVVHLLQDMGQPQHTRNDAHAGFGCAGIGACVAGHASFFESYLMARTTGAPSFTLTERLAPAAPVITNEITFETTRPQLLYTGYTKPKFNNYEDFFYTETGAANAGGKGLANYSSRGFYSFGTNIGKTTLPQPHPSGVGLTPVTVSSGLVDMTGQPIAGTTVFKTGTVIDTVHGGSATETGVKLSTVGIWNRALQQKNPAFSSHSLNHYNYDDQARLLIPRAVAYSAGLIDYFFRGSLEITPPDEGAYSVIDHYDIAGEGKPATNASQDNKGFKVIKLKIRNTTEDISPSGGGTAVPQNMTSGKLVAVLKFHRNLNYTDDLAGDPTEGNNFFANRSLTEEIIVSDRVKDEAGAVLPTITLTADPNKSSPAKLLYFEFDKELPINATDVYLQVVYRGALGSEADAVAVETKDISEPSYFAYMNASDYIRLGQKVYTRAEINSTGTAPGVTESGSQLRALVRPTNCIDNMTDQLKANCFLDFPINFAMQFGVSSSTNNAAASLALAQSRRYSRLVILQPRPAGATLDQSASPCFPRDAISVPARIVQVDYSESSITYFVSAYSPTAVRAVNGLVIACVQNGDGTAPSMVTDNRNTQMKALTGVDLKPKQIQNFKFGAP